MINSVDTNILLDVLIPNTAQVQSSLRCLSKAVFAELGSQFLSFNDLITFLRDTGITLVPSNENSLFEASRAWKKYSERQKNTIVCPACGKKQTLLCSACQKVIPSRQHILGDFLIGAHAKIQSDRLITRDRGFYRSYFKDLKILTPS